MQHRFTVPHDSPASLPATAPCYDRASQPRITTQTRAAQHGITGIGALWGYGGEAELRAHGARHLAGGMQEVPALVRRAFGL